MVILLLLAHTPAAHAQQELLSHWTGTWATAPQTPVKSFMPYNNDMSNRSVRQIVKVSAGGNIVKLKLTNIFSTEPVVIRSVYLAEATDSFAINARSASYFRFAGKRRVTIAAGGTVTSDAMRFNLRPLEKVAITINYIKAPKSPTVHMGSRTTSYIMKGSTTPRTRFDGCFPYEKWFNIAALDVYTSDVRTIAILGNSITDGKGSTTNHQNRWPDMMSEELNRAYAKTFSLETDRTRQQQQPVRHEQQWAVLNLGIGNNRVLTVGYGQPGKDRFNRDILQQNGLTDVIIFEGINDLGTSRDARTTARRLIEQYQLMIRKAKARHLRVWLATITPMKGAGYFSADHEAGREMVNRWIREQHEANGVIDFDELMRDPKNPQALRANWRLSDCLHPNAEGYRQMGRFAAEKLKTSVTATKTAKVTRR